MKDPRWGIELENLPQPPPKPMKLGAKPPSALDALSKPSRGKGKFSRARRRGGFRFFRRRRASFFSRFMKTTFSTWLAAAAKGRKRAASIRNHGFTGAGRGFKTGFAGRKR